MTKTQWKVKTEQEIAWIHYGLREFRKKCVTQGIVEFVREEGHALYEMKYRGVFVCTIFNDGDDELKLIAVWNTIKIAENNRKD